MSRIGRIPIQLSDTVQVQIKDRSIHVEGPKGKLNFTIPSGIKAQEAGRKIVIERSSDSKEDKALHGLARSIIANMVQGVTQGFQKELEINGIGFRGQVQGKQFSMNLGFTHPVEMIIPEGITIETPKPTQIIVKGADKAKVGQCAAVIRSYFPPEPYKGKGIRYINEHVRRKAGKTVAKTSA